MRYLLDTTTLIDFSKGREPVRSRILSMIDTGEELGICAINVAEFYSGVPVSERTIWDDFIGALAYWEITRDGATKAGHDRHGFLQRGQTLSTTDALVAAVAREQQATLVTDNTNDYPMTDIVLLSLRE